MLAVSSPLIGQEELDAIKPVFESGWLGLGSTTYAFEKAVSCAREGFSPVTA